MLPSPQRIAAEALRLVPRNAVSRFVGRAAGLRGPEKAVQQAVDAFVRVYGVDVSEAVVPPGGYRSFNDFFTRELVAGARPIDRSPDVWVSPADGKLEDFGPVDADALFTIKGRPYDAVELLGDRALADRYRGGTYYIVYLSPRDYHRVHAPVTGQVTRLRYLAGTLYPVNSIGTDHVDRVFARNERVVVVQRSESFGEVATVLVGAIGVGRIGIAFDPVESNIGSAAFDRELTSGPTLRAGDELGRFNLGSTVIGFLPPKTALRVESPRGSAVRMGRALGRKEPR